MILPSLIEKIHGQPHLRRSMHGLFWLLLFAVRLYITVISFNVYEGFPPAAFISLAFFNTLLLAAAYYILVYWITPRFIIPKRYFLSVFLILGLLTAYTTIDAFLELHFIKQCTACQLALDKYNAVYGTYLHRGLINIVFTRLFSLGTPLFLACALCIPLSLKLALQSYREKLKAVQMARDNLELEFNFLKAQLNPHFLFNTMNNIYGLIINGEKEQSAALVARLSELLRYTLYDSNEDIMPLTREIQMIQDYIELEKVRLNETSIRFQYTMDHNGYAIAPLLLMPLIENTFKFSGDNKDSFISIFLEIANGRLRCKMENSIDSNRLSSQASGIGLNNFRKRMELYYHDKYEYAVHVNDEIYLVNLSIEI
ncbi:sensor histidine kinase [Parasegetibacter sp. MAH-26]|uniref:Sensor histidine kinase n=2 Tax=Pinibacter aurantiacus TaxID=2851599 RepID=A0A9E2SC73_9BACT|nr:sensor histidine kinase [Pinibacter aurantiacus]